MHISTNSFSNCKSLQEITLPETAEFIYCAFFGCSSLKSMTVPESVKTIIKHSIGYEGNYYHRDRIAGFVLRGKPGSAAEDYAKQNDIRFVPVSSNEKEN